MTQLEFWENFVNKTGLDGDAKYAGEFGFEARGFEGTERLAALAAGKKTAAFFSYAAFAVDNEELPVSGEYYIVLDGNGEPFCIIKTTRVQVIPFDQVSWELAAREGEDSSLQEWRDRTRENLVEEGAIVGFDFSPDMKLVCVEFRLAERNIVAPASKIHYNAVV